MSSCIMSADALNLEEALSAAYTKNQGLKASQQVFLQEIEQFPRALADFLPDIRAKITTSNSKTKSDSQFDNPNLTRRPLHSTSTGPDVARNLTITQNLFSGGSSVMGMKVAQAGFWVSRSKLYKSEQKTLGDAVESYLNVYAAREKLNIAMDSLNFAKQNFDMVQEKLKVGEATVTEVALASASLANAEAKKSAQYSALIAANADFRTTVGIEPEEDMPFPSIPEKLPETLEQLEALVNKSNLDLLSKKYEMMQAKHGIKVAEASLLPEADLKLSAEKDFFRPESTARKNTMSYSTSLEVTIPILSKGGVEYSKIRAQKKASRQAVYTLDFVEKQLKAQVISIWESYIASKDSIAFVDKAVEAQTLALDGIKQQYAVGSATMLDVLKSQEDLNKSKSDGVDTKKNYILTAYKLKDLMGQMTASQLKLNVKYFSPEQEFRHIKHKVMGF